jgi:hypothetical protein
MNRIKGKLKKILNPGNMKELDLLKKIGKRVIILLIKYRKPRFIK